MRERETRVIVVGRLGLSEANVVRGAAGSCSNDRVHHLRRSNLSSSRQHTCTCSAVHKRTGTSCTVGTKPVGNVDTHSGQFERGRHWQASGRAE